MGLSYHSFSSTKHEENKTRKTQHNTGSSPITTTTFICSEDGVAPSSQPLIKQKQQLLIPLRKQTEFMAALSIVKKKMTEEGALLSGATLAALESLSMPLIQEVVFSADIRCSDCQKRIADIISRMTETESVLINVFEKEVTITCRYPSIADKLSRGQVTAVKTNPSYKMAIIKRFFRYSRN